MKYVHLAIPYTSGICVGTMEAANYKALDLNRDRRAVIDKLSNTVAGNCFNELFCRCLDNVELPEGSEFDYFCLLHSDVVPITPFWLDVLIDELEEHGAAAIHAPCCIKDTRGITSTAVGNLDDEWDSHRKLTLKELHRLPETFGLVDVLKLWEADETGSVGRCFSGKRLFFAPNTGCLVLKRGDWWRLFPGFEQRSRIVYWLDEETPRSRAQMSPEDWRFGRWMAGQDLKVLGTRKVVTAHLGACPWATSEPWGTDDRDSLYLKSIEESQRGFHSFA